ncbi:MAG: hypothetical protein Q9186_006770 [Xanthomendoza sp. 1 TL-2023]
MTDGPPGDTRRTGLSPRPKGRVKATPTAAQTESVKKRFNVDSPSFTPASLAVNGNQTKSKATGISPKFANAAPFKPKGIASRPASTAPSSAPLAKGYNPNAPEWTAPDVQEFVPASYNSIPSSFDRNRIFHASSSTLSANAVPFQSQLASVDSLSPNNNQRSISYPSAKNRSTEGPPLSEYYFQSLRRDASAPPHIEAEELGQQSTPPNNLAPHRRSNDASISGQPSNQGSRLSLGEAYLATPYASEELSATPRRHGKNRREAHSDEPSLYKRSIMQSGNPLYLPSKIDWSFEPPPGSFQTWQPSSRERTWAAYSSPGPSTSYHATLSPNQHPNTPSSTQLDPSSHSHPLSNNVLNSVRQGSFQADQNGDSSQSAVFDQYTPTPSIASQSQPNPSTQINPYSQDGSAMGPGTYYPGSTNYPQQLQHHLYAALPPHREPNQPNQRTAKDFFIDENLRQTLTRKNEASLMAIPNSTLPTAIAHYHSLVPLVHNSQKGDTLFGYKNHAYRATSGHDGKLYCLRRLQGYRVNEASSEYAIRNIQHNWTRVRNSNVVSVHLAFTNSSFGDSSLIFVTDFHPLAETLAQRHFASLHRYTNRYSASHVPEQTLWGYIVQVANALKSIHSAGLAARVLDATKILLTSEGQIGLNACGVLDVLQAGTDQSLADLQRMDLVLLGKLILALGSNNASQHNQAKALESFSRSYSSRLRTVTNWLLECISAKPSDTIDDLASRISSEMLSTFDSFGHSKNVLQSALARELENSRIARLSMKIHNITDRPEYEHDRQWAEHGNRYCIKLFRDYVFHQVNGQGNPVLDMAHMIACLNKLDVGTEEKIQLTTRDEETCMVVSYKELKACMDGAWQDLKRRAAS